MADSPHTSLLRPPADPAWSSDVRQGMNFPAAGFAGVC